MDYEIEDFELENELEIEDFNVDVAYQKDHSKLINRDLQDQHPISAITGLQEALDNSGKIEDVKVNNTSVVSNKVANINLKTINNQSIQGTGNIDIDVENVVKTTANQGLTNQQKINAKANIEAIGTENIKQATGQSTTDVISQKGITDALNNKQDNKPDGVHALISTDTGKLDLIYIPSTVLGGITNGGTFNGSGIITASSFAPELQGEKIDEVEFGSYPSYYFICSAPYSFAGFDFTYGDWAISLGNGWAKLNATDAVTSVNNKMGQVVLNYDDVGATKKSWGIDNANKNLVTDSQGNVTTSDYALGQIIVDYYEELPTNVPVTAKASVINSSSTFAPYDYETLYDSFEQSNILNEVIFKPVALRPAREDYISFYQEQGGYADVNYSLGPGTIEPTVTIAYTNEVGEYTEYCYSFIQQPFSSDEHFTLEIGWNKITTDTETYDYIVESIPASEVVRLTNAFVGYMDDESFDENFIANIGYPSPHLAGEYIYTEVQPSTNPKTYYWKYNPTNVQSDFNITDTLDLGYIKNKPILNTTSDLTLAPQLQLITGTINLHKISKTGKYDDLIRPVGLRTGLGEIFNNYDGATKNTASGQYSHAEGYHTDATAEYSHAEGYYTAVTGSKAHVEGYGTGATGEAAHAEGTNTSALGIASHSEGGNGTASGNYSHVEGWGGSAVAYAHKEGNNCNAYGQESHAEGYYCNANNEGSHAEGNGSSTNGDFSHAENYSTTYGSYSHGEGYGTIAGSSYQHVQGKWNVRDDNNTYADIIGAGTDTNNRSNIQTTDWSGNLWVKGDIRVGGTDWSSGTPVGGGGSTAKKKTLTNASQNYSVSNNVVTVTDNDVTASTMINLYPADTATETWLENNLASCIITEATGSFSFNISTSLPATFSMYYIITEVE